MRIHVLPLAAFLAAFLACSDGDRTEEERYFVELQAADRAVLNQIEAASESFDSPSPLEQLLNDLDDLSPPNSLSALHDRLVTASRRYIAVIGEADLSTPEAGQVETVLAEWNASCQEMLDRGRNAGLELAVLCGAFTGVGEEEDGCPPANEHLSGCVESEAPPLPVGTVALSRYLRFEGRGEPAIVALPIDPPQSSAEGIAFYSYMNGNWHRVSGVVLKQAGTLAEAEFDPVPTNLIVLRED